MVRAFCCTWRHVATRRNHHPCLLLAPAERGKTATVVLIGCLRKLLVRKTMARSRPFGSVRP